MPRDRGDGRGGDGTTTAELFLEVIEQIVRRGREVLVVAAMGGVHQDVAHGAEVFGKFVVHVDAASTAGRGRDFHGSRHSRSFSSAVSITALTARRRVEAEVPGLRPSEAQWFSSSTRSWMVTVWAT